MAFASFMFDFADTAAYAAFAALPHGAVALYIDLKVQAANEPDAGVVYHRKAMAARIGTNPKAVDLYVERLLNLGMIAIEAASPYARIIVNATARQVAAFREKRGHQPHTRVAPALHADEKVSNIKGAEMTNLKENLNEVLLPSSNEEDRADARPTTFEERRRKMIEANIGSPEIDADHVKTVEAAKLKDVDRRAAAELVKPQPSEAAARKKRCYAAGVQLYMAAGVKRDGAGAIVTKQIAKYGVEPVLTIIEFATKTQALEPVQYVQKALSKQAGRATEEHAEVPFQL